MTESKFKLIQHDVSYKNLNRREKRSSLQNIVLSYENKISLSVKSKRLFTQVSLKYKITVRCIYLKTAGCVGRERKKHFTPVRYFSIFNNSLMASFMRRKQIMKWRKKIYSTVS